MNFYSNKFNKQFNAPISHVDSGLHGVAHQQQNNYLYESAFGSGVNMAGVNSVAGSPFNVPHYMYPQQQYNLKMSGGNHEQAAEYGPPHYAGGSGNSGSGYGVPKFQSSKNKIKGTALSALTLLAFLYFLNLLQTCLRDQMNTMNPTVLVMTAGSREGLSKNDRVGTIDVEPEINSDIDNFEIKTKTHEENTRKDVQWDLLKPQISIKPKLQNLFLESQSWG